MRPLEAGCTGAGKVFHPFPNTPCFLPLQGKKPPWESGLAGRALSPGEGNALRPRGLACLLPTPQVSLGTGKTEASPKPRGRRSPPLVQPQEAVHLLCHLAFLNNLVGFLFESTMWGGEAEAVAPMACCPASFS